MMRFVLGLLVIAGCARPNEERTLVVFAAASLREAFVAIAADFGRHRPGVVVKFNFAGSQELRTQIEHGARVDVVATADAHAIEALQAAGKVSESFVFATNEPVIVVRAGNLSVRSLADLATTERIVLGAPEVPIGRYSRQIFDRAGRTLGADFRARVEANVISNELNVRQVLAKVRLGEAEAGIVYRSDVGPGVRVVAIPPALNVVAEYPVAVVVGASQQEVAQAFLAHLKSPAGQKLLASAGFGLPVASP